MYKEMSVEVTEDKGLNVPCQVVVSLTGKPVDIVPWIPLFSDNCLGSLRNLHYETPYTHMP